MTDAAPPRASGSRPVTSLIVGAVVAGIEGVALLANAAITGVDAGLHGITGPPEVAGPVTLALEITIFGVFGLALLLAARGLWRARRWARSMLVVGQFIALVVGVPLVTAAGGVERSAGIALVALGIVGLIAAFWPSTTAAVAES